MSIVIDEHTRVIVQGITGRLSGLHVEEMLAYGTNIVGGVTPGRAGETVQGVPVFNTMREAVAKTGANVSIVFVPPPFAADAIMEAAQAGIGTCVCITDGIPVQDMMAVKRFMQKFRRENRMQLIGPNCAGVISPGKSLVGIMPEAIFLPGRVGIIGRSGTLGYEAASQLKAVGIGVSTSVGIGGDPINGSSFRDHLEAFEADPDTDLVIMIGEIGGPQEVAAGAFVRDHMTKPVAAYIAGLTAPPGRTMGHAGAIVTTEGESAAEKVKLLAECGVTIIERPSEFGDTVGNLLASTPAVV
ncbi:MAG: malate-CoA ligase subunit alpha [Verrucomicrobiales bacterium]|jgi:malate-CoA ligase subunit alpha